MNFTKFLIISVVITGLTACGGGSSSSDNKVNQLPSTSLNSAQGFWRTPEGSANSVSAVVLPDGNTWILINNADGSRVVKASLLTGNKKFLAQGKDFILGNNNNTESNLIITVAEKEFLELNLKSANNQEIFILNYRKRYETTAFLPDFAGNWRATLGPGTLNWTISPAGVLTGDRSTGCTYNGQLSLRVERKAVVDAAVTETCGRAVVPLRGIAVMTDDMTAISLTLTTSEDLEAVVVNLSR